MIAIWYLCIFVTAQPSQYGMPREAAMAHYHNDKNSNMSVRVR